MTAAATTHDDGTLYQPALTPTLVDVPAMLFAMVDGSGPPGSGEFQLAVAALYSFSYPLAMGMRRRGVDVHVRPLEGLWWAEDMAAFQPESQDRDQWRWTLLIRQPEHAAADEITDAFERAARKVGPSTRDLLRLERFDEGRCAQLLHLGPYAAEASSVRRLHEFIAAQGLRPRGAHHEIYLSDPRRSPPERMRTVLRQPVD